MGFLGLLGKREPKEEVPTMFRLASGTFTVDSAGKVLASTLPQSFPPACTTAISRVILDLFRLARENALGLSELNADYALLRLTARELRGGAIIYLSPRPIHKN